jgi:hypothetical protein
MLQLTIAMVFVIVGATCALWVFLLYKLLPLYRSGAVQGAHRPAFQAAAALLSWVTMQIAVWLLMRNDAAAALLSVLWAIGLLAWLTLATVSRTRRQVRNETAQIHPRPTVKPQAAPPNPPPPVPPDISRYTVRRVSQPAAAAATAPRSARVRRIMSIGESYGD